MQNEYIKAGYTEIREEQIDPAELVIEDPDNSDNMGEREIVALVVQEFESGDRLAVVQLTKDGARKLHAALEARLSQTFV